MAITEIAEYAHLDDADVESLASRLDEIRVDVESSLGAKDRAYIKRAITFQRCLEAAARLTIFGSGGKIGWAVGTTALMVSKCIENMELSHNICHGQWDWMNDPEIHSNTWEWDMVSPSSQWRFSHNYLHHVYTNVIGKDEDLGYGVVRVSRDQEWKPSFLVAPLRALLMAITFEWGIALHDLFAVQSTEPDDEVKAQNKRAMIHKMGRQAGKDYLFFPLLSGRRFVRTFLANLVANGFRNSWAYIVIVVGHFVDGAEKFTAASIENETKGQWYLRQILGTANFDAGPVMAFMSGNLCYQIEHHLFPDLPSNRYADMSVRIKALLAEYDLPYTTGPLTRQFWNTVWTIWKLALPDDLLTATSDDAPETASEAKFRAEPSEPELFAPHQIGTTHRGLNTALAEQARRHALQVAIPERAERRVRRSALRTAQRAAIAALRIA
ncbi:MAG: fatty acid desaturase family protein [Mycobacterium sp.]